MENTQMELLEKDAGYLEIAKTAKSLGIPHTNVKKDILFGQVNDKIAKINSGEVTVEPEAVVEVDQEVEVTTETNEGEATSPAEAAAKKAATQKRERTVRQAAKKWFEEEGTNPYNEGDVVEIFAGKDLVGRKLQVTAPSAKKDMIKGKLINPVNGGLQNTVIAISFDRIKLVQSAGSIAQEEPQEAQDNVEEVTPEVVENITEGSEEASLPQLEVEEVEKEVKEAK